MLASIKAKLSPVHPGTRPIPDEDEDEPLNANTTVAAATASATTPAGAVAASAEVSSWAPHVWRTTTLAPKRKGRYEILSPVFRAFVERVKVDMRRVSPAAASESQMRRKDIGVHIVADMHGHGYVLEGLEAALSYTGLEMRQEHSYTCAPNDASASSDGAIKALLKGKGKAPAADTSSNPANTYGSFLITSSQRRRYAEDWTEEDRARIYTTNVLVLLVWLPILSYQQIDSLLPVSVYMCPSQDHT